MEDILVLDSAIRNWVLIPIVAVMFVVAILRSNITMLMQEDKKTDLKSIQQRYDLHYCSNYLYTCNMIYINSKYYSQTLLRTKRLITNGNKLHYGAFEARRALFNDKVNTCINEVFGMNNH